VRNEFKGKSSCVMAVMTLTFLLVSFGSTPAFAVPTPDAGTSVSVSPGELSFGIPTGTPVPLTSTQTVTVSVTGSGQAALSNFSITGGAYAGDFTNRAADACAIEQHYLAP
jgi:hypothetical protein